MGLSLKLGEVNTVEAGTVIFEEKTPVTCVCAIVRGKVTAKLDNVHIDYNAGSFVGCPDVVKGRYLMEYVATERTILFPFEITEAHSFREVVLANNKEYRGIVMAGLAQNYGDLAKINSTYKEYAQSLFNKLTEISSKYSAACKNGGVAEESLGFIDNLAEFHDEKPVNEEKLTYYIELSQVPTDAVKVFFTHTTHIVLDSLADLCTQFNALLENTLEVGDYVVNAYTTLFNNGESNLLSACVRLSKQLEKAGRSDKSLEALCQDIMNYFLEAEKEITACMGNPIIASRDRLKKVYASLTDGSEIAATPGDKPKENPDDILRSLKGSLKQIINFSKADEKTAVAFEEAVNNFVDLKERLSSDDDARKLRRHVADSFYKIYRGCFKNSLTSNKIPRAVDLFLNYNFVDERLLKPEEILELCELKVDSDKKYIANIYTVPEWLKLVYSGKKMPSKNEFDLEYAEHLRERKKSHEIDDAEEKALFTNMEERLDFEIFNMFKTNHRIVNGQMSTFVPVLCSEQLMGTPLKLVLTKDRIGQAMEKYHEIDYSVFRREQVFATEDRSIEKEPIMLEVGPDIVLFPGYGSNAIMWQEISAKKRDSSGRFFFPVLLESGLDDLIIKTLGRFRWELCRTMQGSAWNDVTVKSLTSEYCDYIQFYKKNKELSDEKKEKVKLQIQKGKNNTREVFVQDYEQWIKGESQGGQKLNKPSRSILAAYCPFNKEIRTNLKTQPAFQDAIEKFERERTKRAKEIDLRHRALIKKGLEIPEIMKETLDFYVNR